MRRRGRVAREGRDSPSVPTPVNKGHHPSGMMNMRAPTLDSAMVESDHLAAVRRFVDTQRGRARDLMRKRPYLSQRAPAFVAASDQVRDPYVVGRDIRSERSPRRERCRGDRARGAVAYTRRRRSFHRSAAVDGDPVGQIVDESIPERRCVAARRSTPRQHPEHRASLGRVIEQRLCCGDRGGEAATEHLAQALRRALLGGVAAGDRAAPNRRAVPVRRDLHARQGRHPRDGAAPRRVRQERSTAATRVRGGESAGR